MSSFLGRATYSIDHKGRITIPAPMRRDADTKESIDTFYIAPGFDGCVALYSPVEWKRIADQLRAIPLGDRDGRAFVRAFLMDVSQVTVDGQGRISIPSSLMSRAGLGKEAVLHGTLRCIEIWNPERHRKEEALVQNRFEEFAARLLGGKT